MFTALAVCLLGRTGEPHAFPLLPRPTIDRLDWKHPLHFKTGKKPPAIRVKPLGRPGFRVVFRRSGIEIDADSLASQATARAYVKQLTIQGTPSGFVECRPRVGWRGVHLFAGPSALEFQKRLWTRVLLPLGFNKVVLQCEQAEWKCLPNLRGGIDMKLNDLRQLCDWYRSVGVEVIPLVESFGHVAWLCKGGKNLDLMINPRVPFTVDPRKPAVAKLYERLWDEVIAVTKAKTVHFGLDEVDFRGFPPDKAMVTRLWKIQVPMLARIARRHKVKMMLWGDEVLAPQDGAGPASAASSQDARDRRSVIPRGATICDWHYQNNADPAFYEASLRLLRREGFSTIASAWNPPNNIRGQSVAAIETHSGLLVTTWAGYESNEKTMRGQINQFSSMVLASDYLWSDRAKLSASVGYDPVMVFKALFDGRANGTLLEDSPKPP